MWAESDRPGEVELGPVRRIPTDAAEEKPQPGIGLCLSGGGYRAMLFHAGSLIRLKELGVLARVDRISSVSGGSIIAGLLAIRWGDMELASLDTAALKRHVIDPIRKLASTTIDVPSVIGGLGWFGSASDRIEKAYRQHLFGEATLQDFPDHPRFVINATNVQSMALWRFSKPYMGDYRVGRIFKPRISLSKAVAASSAFPPVLSPTELELDPKDFASGTGDDLQREPFTSKVILTDGGVYDNLGMETVWKRCRTVLISDGGGKSPAEEEPKRDWVRHSARILFLIDNQVRSLRLREIIDAYKDEKDDHNGVYWGIRTSIASYETKGALPCPPDRTRELALWPTRLRRVDPTIQERIINWGYAVCDAAVRSFESGHKAPSAFPYPQTGV